MDAWLGRGFLSSRLIRILDFFFFEIFFELESLGLLSVGKRGFLSRTTRHRTIETKIWWNGDLSFTDGVGL